LRQRAWIDFWAPNSPAGRISSTMVMMMKMAVVEASG